MSNVAFPYTNALRTLMPLRLSGVLDGEIVASALLYPSVDGECAFFLVRSRDGEYSVSLFQRKSLLYSEFENHTRRDVDVANDFLRVTLRVSSEQAKRIVQMWELEMFSVGQEPAPTVLDRNLFELGLVPSMSSGGRFQRRQTHSSMCETSPIIEMCYRFWLMDFADAAGTRAGALAVLENSLPH